MHKGNSHEREVPLAKIILYCDNSPKSIQVRLPFESPEALLEQNRSSPNHFGTDASHVATSESILQ